MPQLKIESLDATLGAVLTDVDLSLVDDDTWQAIHAAFLEYAVLIFPGQNITPEQHIAFGSRFGNIEEMAPGVQLVYLSNKLPDGSLSQDGEHLTQILRGVEVWHTDSSYMPLGSKAQFWQLRKYRQRVDKLSGRTCARVTMPYLKG